MVAATVETSAGSVRVTVQVAVDPAVTDGPFEAWEVIEEPATGTAIVLLRGQRDGHGYLL